MSEHGLEPNFSEPLEGVPAEYTHLFDPFERQTFANPLEQQAADFGHVLGHAVAELYGQNYQSTHDSLTGLANRRGFAEAVAPHQEDMEEGGNYAVAVLDLDEFKAVNDELGHAYGDYVLKQVCARIARNIRTDGGGGHHDIAALARAGGDEIWLLIDLNTPAVRNGQPSERRQVSGTQVLTDEEKVERTDDILERVRTSINEFRDGDEQLKPLNFGVSIGAAIAKPGRNLANLIDLADGQASLDKLRQAPDLTLVGRTAMRGAFVLMDVAGVNPRNAAKMKRKLTHRPRITSSTKLEAA